MGDARGYWALSKRDSVDWCRIADGRWFAGDAFGECDGVLRYVPDGQGRG